MKITWKNLSCLSAFALGVLASTTVASAQLASDINVNNFDDASENANWAKWWGSAATSDIAVDFTQDASNSPSSGALKLVANFDAAAFPGDNQFAYSGGLQPGSSSFTARVIDASAYDKLTFDLLWDTTNSPSSGGNFGGLDIGLATAGSGQVWLTNVTITADPGWHHLVIPIDPTLPGLTNVGGIVLKMWNADITGTATFWVDNVNLVASSVVAPPPTLDISRAITPGLNLYASNPNDQYQRQNIRLINNSGTSWVNAADPVSYSVAIANYPTQANFQTHIMLVPGTPGNESAPDWNEPNVIFFDIHNNGDGSGYAAFRYKTNAPNGNAMYYDGTGNPGTVGSSTMRGTWTVSFNQNTNVTLTAPDGTTTSFVIPDEAAALFAEPLNLYVGVQPNTLSNIGQGAVINQVAITNGSYAVVSDNFSQGLDSSVWQKVAADQNGIVPVPNDAVCWVNWTLPDSGFNLQSTPSLNGDPWTDLQLPVYQFNGKKHVAVTQSAVSGTNQNYFRLIKLVQ
jgi:hypothetical protein